ncbi:hypothetical protein HH212_22885 [Massilia forsythiae]|uniref:Uncharacterized protein n=1 Tax=Massilia forsythiae TaxID=2728020 RepID=A0A7Z2VZV2_9BURK|nr:hypothetical protein [Massilia forsythiae]QJE02513.1 hypothetical protein HH212_22885 [Massilia forsythiae]
MVIEPGLTLPRCFEMKESSPKGCAMANSRTFEALAKPPDTIPVRRFHESMVTVLRLAEIFGGDEAKIAREAKMKSELEWGMDMEWLDGIDLRWDLSPKQRQEFEQQFRQRHRDIWGAFAYEGD